MLSRTVLALRVSRCGPPLTLCIKSDNSTNEVKLGRGVA